MLILAASLFFVNPAPLDMPRAEAFLVTEDGKRRLEDRYDKLDLWMSQAIVGRWLDDEGRMFTLSTLDWEPPAIEEHATLTRRDYVSQRVPMKRVRANAKYPAPFRRAIALLADCSLAEERPRPPRQLPRGYRDVDYWQHPTNYTTIVCAFRQEKSERWYLATWDLIEGDDYPERMTVFEDLFLRKDFRDFQVSRVLQAAPDSKSAKASPSERELLRADARHSVAAYANWHVTDSTEFTVLDDLPGRGFVETLTNALVQMRAEYVRTVPTELDGTNALCVARIYATREEYLAALETDGNTNMSWSAAYWSPERRELVAYLPANGEAELLKTFRHEAFHQYLSYACSMIAASPWINEGYAQYFEDPEDEDWALGIDWTKDGVERLAALLPGMFGMDYGQFYAGTDLQRRFSYRLAWSVAVFLEKGADKVRFRPFADLKRDYFRSLLREQDMRRATSAAFRNEDTLKLFIREWKKFWLDR